VRLGFAIPTHGALRDPGALRALAEAAEDLGFHSVWVSEHIVVPPELFNPFGELYDCLGAISYVAGVTTRVQLGTSILILPLHEPILLAKQAATVHELSGGRLRLGVGVGWLAEEYVLMGADFHRRGVTMDKHLAVLRRFLSTDPSSETEPPELTSVRFAPTVRTKLPILIGGHALPALQRAANVGDGWHGVWLEPDEVPFYVAATRGRSDRNDFHISLRLDFAIRESCQASQPMQGLRGTREQVASRIREYRDAGVDELILDPMDRDDHSVPSLRIILDQLHVFASDVLPQLKSLVT